MVTMAVAFIAVTVGPDDVVLHGVVAAVATVGLCLAVTEKSVAQREVRDWANITVAGISWVLVVGLRPDQG